ncbi:MAG: hypothetical protein K7J47_19825 [Acidobacteria bacterium]|nr:hypothetical protein [Bryobacteraceae bacterium CoA2 C42]
MPKPLYTTTRNLHLYAGLFLSPFVLLFAVSVFFLVHAPRTAANPTVETRSAAGLPVSPAL